MTQIIIIDFGSQYTQLIARRIRESSVYCEIIPYQDAAEAFDRLQPKGMILSGGPASVNDDDAESPSIPDSLFEAGVPMLGICYGQMLMAKHYGGKIKSSDDQREFGRSFIHTEQKCPLFEGVWKPGEKHPVWMSHGDCVSELPDGMETYATTKSAPHAVFGDPERNHYGMMFHPEVSHTKLGAQILQKFVLNISGCDRDWSMNSFKAKAIEDIRNKVGDSRVICGLSGGVDSTVTAALVHEAIGEQLTCIFVDHGLMRAGEAETVTDMFHKHFPDLPLQSTDASDRFLNALQGVSDPERKRKLIGGMFIDVFEQEAESIGDVKFLAQGTLYPDVIESLHPSGGSSSVIKSHHNVGGLPERMDLQLLEPLRELFKDEVRKLGRELNIPDEFIGRHPFPGPGLAIRCLDAITPENLEMLRKADAIYLDEIREAGLYDKIWQAFAVLLPVRSVGVMGDGRTYEKVCSLRAVTSDDGMTADFYPFDMELLGRISTRIVNEVPGINRVVYDVTSKPPGTVEWE